MRNTRNYMKLGKQLAAAALAGALLFLVGCQAKPAMAVQTPQATAITSAAVASRLPERGGELSIAIPQGITTYDPLLAQDEDLINMLSLIYETPLTLGADGKFQPGLAETWTMDEAGTTFTFNIRQGVQFHNGNSLTAADIYQTILDVLALDGTYAAGTNTGEGAAATQGASQSEGQAPEAPSGFISGWTSGGGAAQSSAPPSSGQTTGNSGTQSANPGASRYAAYNKEIAGVTLVDDSTIEIKMKKAGRDALYFMTMPVRPKGADFKMPVGSGPYAVGSMDGAVQLGINDKWWKVAPYITGITATPIDLKETKLSLYQQGKLNFVTTDNLAAGKLKTTGKTQVVEYMTNYYDCLIPNLMEGVLKNDQVRQALSFAINRRTLISTVMLNHAVATEMPVSPAFYAFNTKYNTYQIDQDMAKELLAQQGYRTAPDGQGNVLSLSIIVPNEPSIMREEYRLDAATQIAKQLEEVGVECTVEALDLAAYANRLKSGNFTLAYTSYYLDRNGDLSFMFNPDASGNYGHVASDELTADIAACNAAVKEADVIAAYDRLEQYFMDKVPQIGLYYRTNSIVTDDAVAGMGSLYENQIFNDIAVWSMQ